MSIENEEIKTNTDPEAGLDNAPSNEEAPEEVLPTVAETVDHSIDVKDSSLGYDLEDDKPAEAPVKDESAVVADVSERLGASTKTETTEQKQEVATPQNTMPFDVTKLSIEQVQQLKQMLEITPESAKKRIIKPVTQIRVIKGKYLIDAGKSYMKLRKNTLEGRDELAHFIPVKFFGDKDFIEMDYREVMGADRVKCEIVSTRTVDESYIEGEPVTHRETGRLTEREVKVITPYYTIKLPTNETVEIKGSMSNF